MNDFFSLELSRIHLWVNILIILVLDCLLVEDGNSIVLTRGDNIIEIGYWVKNASVFPVCGGKPRKYYSTIQLDNWSIVW